MLSGQRNFFFLRCSLLDDMHPFYDEMNNTHSEHFWWARALTHSTHGSLLQQMIKQLDYRFPELIQTNKLIMPELFRSALITTKEGTLEYIRQGVTPMQWELVQVLHKLCYSSNSTLYVCLVCIGSAFFLCLRVAYIWQYLYTYIQCTCVYQ